MELVCYFRGFTNERDFANLYILLKRGKKNSVTKGRYKSLAAAKDDGAIAVGIGVFLNSILNFVVISVIIFGFVRSINRIKTNKSLATAQCKYCKCNIDPGATRCPHCTSKLDTDDCILCQEGEEEGGGKHKHKSKYLKKTIKKQLSSIDLTAFGGQEY